MKGHYHIRIENRRLIYEFTLRRNITIIRGNSATGKTTLVEMLRSYERDHEESGITVRCEKACVVLTDVRWKENLFAISDSIVFIDENYQFVRSQEFAEAIQNSDNYYVLITRDNLSNLPYSVEEIYGIRTSGKYVGLQKTYNELYRIYSSDIIDKSANLPEVLITEDSNSGHQFFGGAFPNVSCISADGKTHIYRLILENTDKFLFVIADGAAFGPEMERIMRLIETGWPVVLYLPESFEWLILKSDIFKDSEVRRILEEPEEFIDSRQYFSWERFFTKLLVQKTKGSYLNYRKRSLNPVYLHEREKKAILAVMPDQLKCLIEGETDREDKNS